MRKVLIDTNIWVDIALKRPAFYDNSAGAVMACLAEDMEIAIVATSLKDVFYFAEQSRDADAGYRAIEAIMRIAALAPVDSLVCEKALELEQPDYEDGIVAACALIEQVDAIVTRDEQAFTKLDIAKYSPSQFIEHVGYKAIPLA